MKVTVIFFGIAQVLKLTARKYPWFREHLKQKDLTAQLKIMDDSEGRYFTLKGGKLTSKNGIHPNPDICMSFRTAELALSILTKPSDQLNRISAMKNFQLDMTGPDELTSWWSETLSLMLNAGIEYGTDMGNGVKRYTGNTNGGPLFVYVKKGRIIRTTPLELDETDAKPWTIKARGRSFTPPRKTSLAPYALTMKSMVYSPDRLLYPMKRVDFDPNGNRNCANRGTSGYERISWDEALDLVANEIQRVKQTYGPGCIS